MATTFFTPTVLAGYINAFPNTPIRFEDLNADNILCAFPTTWVNPETNANTNVIQVEVVEGGGTAVELKRTTYVFPLNATITNIDTFLAFVDFYAPNNALAKYTQLYAIDNVENILKKVSGVYRPVLFNEEKIVRKVFIPADNKTVIYTNAGNEYKYKPFWVVGDQTNAVEAYYAYGTEG